jgi:large subunit ribosomal protein L11
MADKKVKANIKFRVPAGKATPAPPVGSSLGQHGVNMMDFINAFNDETRSMGDVTLTVHVTVFEDRTFEYRTVTPPAAVMIRQAAGIDKGSGTPNKTKVAELTKAQVAEIAEAKMADLNANDMDAAMKVIAGTARSMGITVQE